MAVKLIVIRTRFAALHHYPDASGSTEFLKHPHRHVFYVEMKWHVADNNREIEFLKKKAEVNLFIGTNFNGQDLGAMSCEDIAETLSKRFKAYFVSVFEDNENGAEYYEDYSVQ